MLLQVSAENLVKNKVILSRDWGLPPPDVDGMPYWEMQMFVNSASELAAEEERKRREEEARAKAEYGRYGGSKKR